MKYFYENDKNEQVGPIDINKLKSINLKSSTLVWKEGTENWLEAKNFEELRELFIKPPPLPSKKNELKIPTNSFIRQVKESENVNKKHSIWSYKGRMRRSEYFGYVFVLGIATKGITYFSESSYEEDPIQLLFLLLIPILYLYVIIAIKRLHDMNFYGIFFFISFIPLINLTLVFWDGIEGANKYGADPKGREPRKKK